MIVSASTYLDALFLLLGDNSERSRLLVREFMDIGEKSNGNKQIITVEDDLVEVYKYLIKSVLAEKINQEDKGASKMLLLKINSIETLRNHPLERDLLTDILTGAEPVSSQQINEYLKRLRNMVLLAEMDSTTKKFFAKAKSVESIKDVEDQEEEILKLKSMFGEAVQTLEKKSNTSDAKASETYVSLSDPESIKRSLQIFVDRNVRGVIKTGLQGLNKALGSRGGFGLGESAVFAALSHNYKSGILVSIMLWTAVYNKFFVEPGRRALIYFVSLENAVDQNLMDVFRAVYCRVEKRNVDVTSLSVEFIQNWIYEYFVQFDVEVFIDRYDPHKFSFQTFTQRYNAFVDMGFQMVLFDLDYLSEARGVDPSDPFSSQGLIQLIREYYKRFHTHAGQQGYLFTTGHQLTKKAAENAANGGRYPVKKFNDSMMADSSDVFRIVDVLIFLHLENNLEGLKFLTAQLRKNRGCRDTPEAHKFFAYPFTEYGIQDDLEGLPQYVTDIDAWNSTTAVSDDAIVDAAMF